jgi:hypothetical protein
MILSNQNILTGVKCHKVRVSENTNKMIQLLKDAKAVENEDNRSSRPITNNTSGESSSHTEENRSSKRSPFLKKLGLFSKNKR